MIITVLHVNHSSVNTTHDIERHAIVPEPWYRRAIQWHV